ncbi:hypothetical protein [Devosia aurantiaca]|uniref:Uncharacterized protein n=1 Tax=Devosia aurantiaca TaxID=2714858 RepID=A0A6M1S9R1_9HYPH|nr:hypothetical protein [Devosia aurantiaca]NGP16547.1 hypothetical protein [Devosia aurantiaca]
MFERTGRIDARQAVQRSLSIGQPTYKPAMAAELLRWAEQQGIVERIEVDGENTWQRLRHGVTFIPRLSLSLDIRTVQPLSEVPSIDALVSQEADLRARKLQKQSDRHLDRLCNLISRMSGSTRVVQEVFDRNGSTSDCAWQLEEALDGLLAQLPLYRLIQIVDAVSRHASTTATSDLCSKRISNSRSIYHWLGAGLPLGPQRRLPIPSCPSPVSENEHA